jgi:hypothetical protein
MNKKYLYLAISGVVGVIFSIVYLVLIQPRPLTKQQYADIYLVCFLQRALNSGDKVKKAERLLLRKSKEYREFINKAAGKGGRPKRRQGYTINLSYPSAE